MSENISNNNAQPLNQESPKTQQESLTPQFQSLANPITENNGKIKPPTIVKITSWLLLIGGIFSLLGVLPFLLLGGLGKSGIILLIGILNLVRGIGLVVVSFGIRQMKKWALYTFTVLTVLAVFVSIYSFFSSSEKELIEFIDVGIQGLILVYFWFIFKRFV